jgi:hypothetical protein
MPFQDREAPTSDTVKGYSTAAQGRMDRSREAAEHVVASYPAIFLGIAVGTGIAIGWWIKRK